MIATDASDSQISAATPHPGVEFRVAPAEASGIEAASVDLVTVAQALHWFDIERFFAEAGRVLAPGGLLAVWSYARCNVSPDCDVAIEKAFDAVEDFWPPERMIVENRYRDISLPFPEIEPEAFDMRVDWTAAEMLNYMSTWSATQRYMAANGHDPVAQYADELAAAWGPEGRDVRWPLTLRIGRRPA